MNRGKKGREGREGGKGGRKGREEREGKRVGKGGEKEGKGGEKEGKGGEDLTATRTYVYTLYMSPITSPLQNSHMSWIQGQLRNTSIPVLQS